MLAMSSPLTSWQSSSSRLLCKREGPCGASFQHDLSAFGAITFDISEIDGLCLALGRSTLLSAPSTATSGQSEATYHLYFYHLNTGYPALTVEDNRSVCTRMLTFQR